MPKQYFNCNSCGSRVEYVAEGHPCEVLTGWLTVAQWKGFGIVDHYNFCSFTCLKRWVDTHIPQVPEVFLKAFEDEKDT